MEVSPTPVDHDPFAGAGSGGTPVEHDPFAVAPVKEPGFLSRLYSNVSTEFKEGTADVRAGEAKTFGKDQSLGQRAAGLGQTTMGAMQQIAAPVAGAAKTVVGDPIRKAVPGEAGNIAARTAELGAGLVAPGAAMKAGGEAVSLGKKLIEDIMAEKPVASSDAMKKLAGSAYDEASAKGGTLTPQFSDNLIDEAARVLPQTEKGKTIAGESAVTKLLERLEKTRGTPTTLHEMQEIDEHLGDLIDSEWSNGRLSKQGAKLAEVQGKFRDMIDSAGPEHISDPNGFDALAKGRATWSQAMKMRDIERIKTRAEYSEQPVTVIRTAIKNILSDPKKLRGYSLEEQDALKKAYKTGVLSGPLRAIGSRLLGHVVGGTAASMGGGIPGFMAGEAVGTGLSAGARKASTGMQMKKLDNVLNVLGRPPGSAQDVAGQLGVEQ